MLQRIQTIYLLVVAGLFVALVFLPLALLHSEADLYVFDVTGIYTVAENTVAKPQDLAYSTWPLFALVCLVALISFAIIFMYKKRVVQMRMCVFNSLIIIGLSLLFGYYLWKLSNSPALPNLEINLRLWTSFPIIGLILNYLSIRKIGSDEFLIRSIDRLR
ncbi:MAG: DUF4293 domain-containing protein [Tannerella sp.]|jgi:hypothetical protein|nr:DUF4293 domain-containing protein [Tannerella sp.]